MNLNDLQTFLKVVETGNFTKAAGLLVVPKSTVSRRVARLEDALGVELLARKARTFTVTADGRQLYARVAPAIRDIADVERELAGAHRGISGPLKITAPHDLGTSEAFARMLSSFAERFPDVVPEVELTMRAVDLLEEGFDVAFRFRGSTPPDDLAGVMVRRLSGLGGRLYASQRYLDLHPAPRSPQELAGHRCIGFSVRRDRLPLERADGSQKIEVAIAPTAVVNDFSLLCALLKEGAGLGFVPDFVAAAPMRHGELVPILPQWVARGGQLSVLWPASRHISPRVRSFIDHAADTLARTLGPLAATNPHPT